MDPKNNCPPAVTYNKGLVLILAVLAGSLGSFASAALNVALPSLNQEFRADAIAQNWVVTSFVLTMAIVSIPSGRLADILGVRKMTVYGILIFLFGTLAAVFSNSITMLIICRVVQGLGSAMVGATIVAIITITFPAKERGKALGVFISAVYFWLTAGPFLGGLLTDYYNWRAIFIFSLPFCLAILLLLLWKIKGEWAGARGERFDYSGSVIFGLALASLIYGFSLLPGAAGIILTIAGLLGIFLFLFWENRIPSPILDVRLFRRNRVFVFSNLASLVTYSATSAIGYLLALYLQYVQGFTPVQAGFILVSQPVIQTIIAPFSGRLSDKIEPRIVASTGMVLLFLGLISLAFFNETTPLAIIIITLLLLGVGFGLFTSPNTNAIMSSVTPKHYAVASSMTGTMRTIGQTLSMGITLVVIAVVIGPVVMSHESHPGFLTGYRISFIIFAILCFAGIFASLARAKSGPQT